MPARDAYLDGLLGIGFFPVSLDGLIEIGQHLP
jgi:hypothetical protein